MQEKQNKILWLAIVLFILALPLQGYRMVVAHNAAAYLSSAKTRVALYQTRVNETDARLGDAKTRHLSVYLASYSLDNEKKQVNDSLKELAKAEKTQHPVKRTALAEKALHNVQGLSVEALNQEIAFLDKAKERWRTEPTELHNQLAKSTAYIDSLEKQGFFPKHFLASRKLIDAAKGRRDLAVKLSSTKFEVGMPDYRRVYANCLDGEKFCRDATDLAKAIPDARSSNASRATELPGKINSAKKLYESAWYAARQLQYYPRYQCIPQVKAAFANLNNGEAMLTDAEESNSFQTQDFVGAANKLSKAEEIVSASVQELQSAIDTWNEMQSAKNAIPSAKSSASTRIDEARNHIDSYSENSQTEAEDYLTEARSYYSSGCGSKDSDPIRSLQSFRDAESKADDAYNAVDTSDHTSYSSGSDDDDGDGFGFGGGSSGYDGGGSSGYDGGGSSGYDGGGGGSYDSGPSGSYDSGPSGSYGDGL